MRDDGNSMGVRARIRPRFRRAHGDLPVAVSAWRSIVLCGGHCYAWSDGRTLASAHERRPRGHRGLRTARRSVLRGSEKCIRNKDGRAASLAQNNEWGPALASAPIVNFLTRPDRTADVSFFPVYLVGGSQQVLRRLRDPGLCRVELRHHGCKVHRIRPLPCHH